MSEVAVVQSPSKKRRPHLLRKRRDRKMARSAHAYVRGSTVKFYQWLDSRRSRDLPHGPAIWICGDCHLGNLGPLADATGEVTIQIRDLDQTVIGNPVHDLIRLALSLASAARSSDLSGLVTVRIVEEVMRGYLSAFSPSAAKADKPDLVRLVLRDARARTWKHLARERLEDLKPTIPLGKTFWSLTTREREAIFALFQHKDVHHLVTRLSGRDDDTSIRAVDAAYWVKGCSSLGRLRIAVLVEIDQPGGKPDYALIDIKEAAQAAAPRYAHAKMPRNNARRVVSGARALSPALGERMLATRLLGRSVFLRELLPQDLKLELEDLSADEALRCARYLGRVVGTAHGRQMEATTRRAWSRQLKGGLHKRFAAPAWLWNSMIELLSSHEKAYLEHCMRLARVN